jgi:hypothetical protein
MSKQILVNCDTDSISWCKEDQSPFTEDERVAILDELNSLTDDLIIWEDDGNYDCVIVVKSKNYVLYSDGKIKYKGSSLRDSKTEPILRDFLQKALEYLIHKRDDELLGLYHDLVKQAHNVTDVSQWAVKKTVTYAVMHSERKNEEKIREALKNKLLREGDKYYFVNVIKGYEPVVKKGEIQYTKDGATKIQQKQTLMLVEDYDGDINVDHLLKRIYAVISILKNVIDIDKFLNYNLRRNKKRLEELLCD